MQVAIHACEDGSVSSPVCRSQHALHVPDKVAAERPCTVQPGSTSGSIRGLYLGEL